MNNTDEKDQNEMLEAMLELATSEARRKQLKEIAKRTFLTNNDFAILFQIHVRSCHRWRRDHRIKHFKMANRVYYSWYAVLEFLRAKQIIFK